MKRYLLALLAVLMLFSAAASAQEEETDWYIFWTQEMGVDIGISNPELQMQFGIDNYVNENGVTSAIIKDQEIVWIREETGGQSTWYGLDNRNGTFDLGERFFVEWMDEGSKEWKQTYDMLDDRHKASAENTLLFDVGVRMPGNESYRVLEQPVKLYVQLGDEWDLDDLKAAYIDRDADEDISVETEMLRYPAGKDSFAVMQLNHFSPYVIYDIAGAAAVNGLPQTGDRSSFGLWAVLLVVFGAAALTMLRRRREAN